MCVLICRSSFPAPESACFVSQENFDKYALIPSFEEYFRQYSVIKPPPKPEVNIEKELEEEICAEQELKDGIARKKPTIQV